MASTNYENDDTDICDILTQVIDEDLPCEGQAVEHTVDNHIKPMLIEKTSSDCELWGKETEGMADNIPLRKVNDDIYSGKCITNPKTEKKNVNNEISRRIRKCFTSLYLPQNKDLKSENNDSPLNKLESQYFDEKDCNTDHDTCNVEMTTNECTESDEEIIFSEVDSQCDEYMDDSQPLLPQHVIVEPKASNMCHNITSDKKQHTHFNNVSKCYEENAPNCNSGVENGTLKSLSYDIYTAHTQIIYPEDRAKVCNKTKENYKPKYKNNFYSNTQDILDDLCTQNDNTKVSNYKKPKCDKVVKKGFHTQRICPVDLNSSIYNMATQIPDIDHNNVENEDIFNANTQNISHNVSKCNEEVVSNYNRVVENCSMKSLGYDIYTADTQMVYPEDRPKVRQNDKSKYKNTQDIFNDLCTQNANTEVSNYKKSKCDEVVNKGFHTQRICPVDLNSSIYNMATQIPDIDQNNVENEDIFNANTQNISHNVSKCNEEVVSNYNRVVENCSMKSLGYDIYTADTQIVYPEDRPKICNKTTEQNDKPKYKNNFYSNTQDILDDLCTQNANTEVGNYKKPKCDEVVKKNIYPQGICPVDLNYSICNMATQILDFDQNNVENEDIFNADMQDVSSKAFQNITHNVLKCNKEIVPNCNSLVENSTMKSLDYDIYTANTQIVYTEDRVKICNKTKENDKPKYKNNFYSNTQDILDDLCTQNANTKVSNYKKPKYDDVVKKDIYTQRICPVDLNYSICNMATQILDFDQNNVENEDIFNADMQDVSSNAFQNITHNVLKCNKEIVPNCNSLVENSTMKSLDYDIYTADTQIAYPETRPKVCNSKNIFKIPSPFIKLHKTKSKTLSPKLLQENTSSKHSLYNNKKDSLLPIHTIVSRNISYDKYLADLPTQIIDKDSEYSILNKVNGNDVAANKKQSDILPVISIKQDKDILCRSTQDVFNGLCSQNDAFKSYDNASVGRIDLCKGTDSIHKMAKQHRIVESVVGNETNTNGNEIIDVKQVFAKGSQSLLVEKESQRKMEMNPASSLDNYGKCNPKHICKVIKVSRMAKNVASKVNLSHKGVKPASESFIRQINKQLKEDKGNFNSQSEEIVNYFHSQEPTLPGIQFHKKSSTNIQDYNTYYSEQILPDPTTHKTFSKIILDNKMHTVEWKSTSSKLQHGVRKRKKKKCHHQEVQGENKEPTK